MLMITLICLAASIYYSGLWHLYVQMRPLLAWGLAAAFVVFANVCFVIGIGLYKHKRFILGTVFMLLWALITVYSIGSTIAGQYNQMLLSTASVYEVSETQLSVNLLENELSILKTPPGTDSETRGILISDIDRRISALEAEQASINSILNNISDIETSANYRTTVRGNRERLQIIIENLDILYAQKTTLLMPAKLPVDKIQELQSEIAKLKQKRDNNITDEEKLSLYDDIFDFLASIFKSMMPDVPGMTSNMVQFITSIFPAILIDLLSPISSALFFYGVNLSGKPGGKQEDNNNVSNTDNNSSYNRGTHDAFKTVNTEIRRRLQETHRS